MYKIVNCSKCGQLQVTSAKKSFLCKYCGKTCEISRAMVHFQTVDPDEALRVVRALKMRAQ